MSAIASSRAGVSAAAIPANGIWDKGTAPADRFQALEQELDNLQKDVFQKLQSKGEGVADSSTIQVMQNECENLRTELQGSMPSYPDPKSYITSLLQKVKQGSCDRIEGWAVSYYAGSSSGPKMAVFINNADQQRNWWAYEKNDIVGNQVSALTDGIKNIEDFVTTCLQDHRPFPQQSAGGAFSKKPKSEILSELFTQEKTDLDSVTKAAVLVKDQGIAETDSYSCMNSMAYLTGKVPYTYNPREIPLE